MHHYKKNIFCTEKTGASEHKINQEKNPNNLQIIEPVM